MSHLWPWVTFRIQSSQPLPAIVSFPHVYSNVTVRVTQKPKATKWNRRNVTPGTFPLLSSQHVGSIPWAPSGGDPAASPGCSEFPESSPRQGLRNAGPCITILKKLP